MKMHVMLFKGVQYMHLQTKNICLKTYMKIRVGEKVYRNTHNIV